MESSWMDMRSAPMDGSIIMLLARRWDRTAEVPVFGQWTGEGWYDIAWLEHEPVRLIPIGWMPRPEFIEYREAFHARSAA